MMASAAAGMPGRPSRVASSPSVAAPPSASDGSSGCCTIRAPKPRGIGQREAHQPGGGDGAAAVGEGDRAGLAQQAEFGQFVAAAAAR